MAYKNIRLDDTSHLIEYYNNYDEDGRLLSRHGQVDLSLNLSFSNSYLCDLGQLA